MTELMKRYEKKSGIELQKILEDELFTGDDFDNFMCGFASFAEEEWMKLQSENAQLKDQLRWRPVSEKPEKDGWILYKRWLNENKIETFDDTCPYFVDTQDEWMSFVRRCNVIRWLPIPPAPEGE